MHEGDKNTKFFHRKAVARAKKKCVKRLRKEDGQTIEDKSEMAQMVTNLFKNLYMADNRVTLEGVTQSFQAKISARMNERLCSKFTEGEISTTLF
jgi:hypothetical protein